VNSLNYLDLLNARQLDWHPVSFYKTKVSATEFLNVDDIIGWIKEKLIGRFYVNRAPMITSDNCLKSLLVLGFEEEKELTYFLLACPFLRRN
jgi:hypothetical protein